MEFCLVLNPLEKCDYNPKLIWFNQIQDLFLCVRNRVRLKEMCRKRSIQRDDWNPGKLTHLQKYYGEDGSLSYQNTFANVPIQEDNNFYFSFDAIPCNCDRWKYLGALHTNDQPRRWGGATDGNHFKLKEATLFLLIEMMGRIVTFKNISI